MGPPDLRALEAMANRKLAEPKASKAANVAVTIGVVVALAGGGFFLFRSLGSASSERGMKEVVKSFRVELTKAHTKAGKAGLGEDDVAALVVDLAKQKGVTLAPSAVQVHADEIEFEYLETKSGAERCKADKKPANFAKVDAEQLNRFSAQVETCKAPRWVVGFESTVDDLKFEAYALLPDFGGAGEE